MAIQVCTPHGKIRKVLTAKYHVQNFLREKCVPRLPSAQVPKRK
jgi:hypothetical protein